MRKIISNVLLLGSLFIFGCYEAQEGCLDVEAVNYDFSADKDVREDCEYPLLRLAFDHRYTTPDTVYTFRLDDSTYLDQAGNPFKVEDLRFYISNVHLIGTNGQEYGVEDELSVYIPQSPGSDSLLEVIIEDNYAITSPSISQTYSIGTLRETFDVASMRFAIGVEGTANEGDPTTLATSHPLNVRDSSLWFSQDSGYVFNYISVFRDTTAADTIPEVLRIGTTPYLQTVELPLGVEKRNGLHYFVRIQIDYQRWFEDINIKEDDKSTLIEKIVTNLPQSFSVVEVELQQN